MAKVFKEYKIAARIFDVVGNLIFVSFDPPKKDTHMKTCFALVKNAHIYTLNKDLKALRLKLGK